MIHFAEIPYGFEFGSAAVTRLFSHAGKGLVVLQLETPKYPITSGLQISVTSTGKVRIYDATGEWKKPKPKRKRSKV